MKKSLLLEGLLLDSPMQLASKPSFSCIILPANVLFRQYYKTITHKLIVLSRLFNTYPDSLFAYKIFSNIYWVSILIFYSYPGGFALYGGRLVDGSLSADLWLYQVVGGRWTLRAQHSPVRPPPLAHHSLTLVRDNWLYILGGSTEQGMFSSKIFKIKLSTGLCNILSVCEIVDGICL